MKEKSDGCRPIICLGVVPLSDFDPADFPDAGKEQEEQQIMIRNARVSGLPVDKEVRFLRSARGLTFFKLVFPLIVLGNMLSGSSLSEEGGFSRAWLFLFTFVLAEKEDCVNAGRCKSLEGSL